MHITNIPALLLKHRHVAATVRATGWHEKTILRYRFDTAMEQHIVINGVLMVTRKNSAAIPSDKW